MNSGRPSSFGGRRLLGERRLALGLGLAVRALGERLGPASVVLFSALLASVEAILARSPPLRPQLLLPIVVYIALEYELLTALVLAVAVGYVGDVFSGSSRGLGLSATVGVFYVLRVLGFRFVGRGFPIVTALTVVATGAEMVLMFVLEHVLGPGRSTFSHVGPSIPIRLLSAAVLGYPIYYLLRSIEARFRPREEVLMGRRRR